MAWRTIAKKDARAVLDAKTHRWFLWLIAVAFVLGGYVLPIGVENPTVGDLSMDMLGFVTLAVPLLGILLGYKAIVAERASGRLGLLLSMPHSRRDVVIGKLVGRGGLLAATITGGIVLASGLVYYPYGTLDLLVLVGYLLVTVAFAMAWVGIALAISTMTTSEHLATGMAFGTFFLLVVVWPQLRPLLEFGLDRIGLTDGGLSDPGLFLFGIMPVSAYRRVVEGFFGGGNGGEFLGPDAAWYLGEEVALVLLVAWAVVPITFGYLRFQNTDL